MTLLFYSIPEIERAYRISRPTLKAKIARGEILAKKLSTSHYGGKTFKYIIPETELDKLQALKLCNPIASEMSQPAYYFEQEKRLEERYRRFQLAKYERWERSYNSTTREREYLQSEAWKKIRALRLKIDGYRCAKCGTAKNLAVHHVTYERLGHEDIDDLLTLCSDCHMTLHNRDLKGEA